ncbi:hypothetical protein [Psychromonas sp. SP041]|uniref:hypothetical protein n=1 Tax=Psychromonas sp. SP041 TaxID=1365007 RepID=UPI0004114228|nr:hypothetical protein [Psychromonas sp. SP041]
MFKNGILASLCITALSACSSSQLTVFDGLAYTAKNEGWYNDPVRGYPLQTTQVSLDGQLHYKIGDLCYADKNRSPMTANCLADSLRNSQYEASVIVHSYPFRPESVGKNDSAPPPTDINTAALDLTNALSATALTLATCQDKAECAEEIKSNREAIIKANKILQDSTNEDNVRVYNWNDNVSASASNNSKNIDTSSEKKTEGYTIVSGYKVFELRMKCIDESRISSEKSGHLKVVTKLISADSIAFVNTQSKLNKLKLQLDVADIKNGTTALLKELATLEVALQSASTISSMANLHKHDTKDYVLYSNDLTKPTEIARIAFEEAEKSKESARSKHADTTRASKHAQNNLSTAKTEKKNATAVLEAINSIETTNQEEFEKVKANAIEAEVKADKRFKKAQEKFDLAHAAKIATETTKREVDLDFYSAKKTLYFANHKLKTYEEYAQPLIDKSKANNNTLPVANSVYLAVLTDLDDLKEHFPSCNRN